MVSTAPNSARKRPWDNTTSAQFFFQVGCRHRCFERPDSVGNIVSAICWKALLGWANFAVNPNTAKFPAARLWHDREIGKPVELAVVATADATEIIEACGKHGVKAIIVLSAGFSETGAHGAALEQAVRPMQALRTASSAPTAWG
jgi:hypothetical protein